MLFNIILEALVSAIRQQKAIKDIQVSKEEVKLLPFAGDMIIYVETLKKHQNLLELIHKFSDVAGYKINIQKSVAFLYTNNEVAVKEIKTIPFTVAPKIIPRDKLNQGGDRHIF